MTELPCSSLVGKKMDGVNGYKFGWGPPKNPFWCKFSFLLSSGSKEEDCQKISNQKLCWPSWLKCKVIHWPQFWKRTIQWVLWKSFSKISNFPTNQKLQFSNQSEAMVAILDVRQGQWTQFWKRSMGKTYMSSGKLKIEIRIFYGVIVKKK